MIRLLLLAIIICAGLFLGPMLVDQKGYVLIAVDDWTIESSVVVMVMVILIFYACLQFLEWALVNLLSLWGRTRYWFGWRKHQLAQQKTLSSLLDLAGGRFALAEKNSARYASLSDQPMLNYLTAANAAQHLGKREQRDKYLASAASIKSDDSALIATHLKMLRADGDTEQSASWLATQPTSVLEQPEILALALPIYQQTKQWPLVLSSATKLLKNKLLSQQEHADIEIEAHLALLDAAADESLDNLHAYYKKLTRKQRNNINLYRRYAELVVKLKGISEVEASYFKLLRKKENACLIPVLMNVKSDELQNCCDKLIALESVFDDCVLFYSTVAHLYTGMRQWDLAKSWYMKAIALEPSATLYHKLAFAQQQLGEETGALASFNHSLKY